MNHGLFLALPDPGQSINEARMQGLGAVAGTRCLNVTGRWAVSGSAHAPLLMWPRDKLSDAEHAAKTASQARAREVRVLSRGASDTNGVGFVEAYSQSRSSALFGALALAEAKATTAQIQKLVAYASAVVRVYGNQTIDLADFVKNKAVVSKELYQQFGGGSTTAVVAWLIGNNGQAAYQLMHTSETDYTDDDFQTVVVGMRLAHHMGRRSIDHDPLGIRLTLF